MSDKTALEILDGSFDENGYLTLGKIAEIRTAIIREAEIATNARQAYD